MQIDVNLANIAKNYHQIQQTLAPGTSCGASVKANAYGLGAARIIPLLYREGCREFFLSNLAEGLQARAYLIDQAGVYPADIGAKTRIYILHGVASLAEAEQVIANKLIPVINSLQQLEIYAQSIKKIYNSSIQSQLIAQKSENSAKSHYPIALHLNSGMQRLGMDFAEFRIFLDSLPYYHALGVHLQLFMSHLACADELESHHNKQQLAIFAQGYQALFSAWSKALPQEAKPPRLSLANSHAIALGHAYHFDLVRPGIALYGGVKGMLPVLESRARIIQKRRLAEAGYVGYNASQFMAAGSRIFTLEAGYADGLFRALRHRLGLRIARGELINFAEKHNIIDKEREELLKNPWILPFCGKISMDLAMVDASSLPEPLYEAANWLEIVGSTQGNTLWEIANSSSITAYELLTSLSPRYPRLYLE